MADGMKLKVVTPTGGFYDGEVSMVELTTTEGEIGVYPNHIPLTAVVAPGVLKIHEDGGEKEAALMSGFITILPEQVTVMAEKSVLQCSRHHLRSKSAVFQPCLCSSPIT